MPAMWISVALLLVRGELPMTGHKLGTARIAFAAVLALLVTAGLAYAPREEGGTEAEQMEVRAHQLLQKAEALEERGSLEDAQAMRRRAEELMKRLRTEPPAAPRREEGIPEGRIEKARARIGTLMEAAEALEREGLGDAARAARGRAEAMEREIAAWRKRMEERAARAPEEPGLQALRERLAHMRREAAELHEAGRHEEAARLTQEAAELEADSRKAHAQEAWRDELARAHEELRREVHELRAAVEEMRHEIARLRAIVQEMRQQREAARTGRLP